MKLGVITDGIDRDLARAFAVMDEFSIDHAELQFVWDHEIGDHSPGQVRQIQQLMSQHGKSIACLSRHIFNKLTVANRPGDAEHAAQMEALKRVIGVAQDLSSPLVRIMSIKKEMILWGSHGAEQWNVAKGAWDALPPLIAPAVELARRENIRLVVETGNGTMVNSSYTGRKLIDDLNARDVLQVLWDPANNCWCHEEAYPTGYEELRDGYLGHVHIKDVQVDTPRSTLEVRPFGHGQLAGQFQPIANALRSDSYNGVVSFESVYHPADGSYEEGFRQCISDFKRTFE